MTKTMNFEISIEEALNSNKTFYAKQWQQNNYYPIEKFVYHADKDAFECFIQKISGWKSYGITSFDNITNKEWHKYIFEHGSYKLSFDEMKDNKHFNCE